MTNISEFLKEIVVFENKIKERGFEVMDALGFNRPIRLKNLSFKEYGVFMYFTFDNPSTFFSSHKTLFLSLENIGKTDEEWINFIRQIKSSTYDREQLISREY